MAKWRPVPVSDGAYTDDARPWSVQDTVNWLPVAAEQTGTRSPAMLRTPPGLREFADVGDGPHRGARSVEGGLFVVSGTGLYKVTAAGEKTLLGTVPGNPRVSMTHNQITNGNELVVGNGSGGYVYNTATATFSQITDSAFPGFTVCDYINSLIVGIEPARRYFFNSELANATSYDSINRFEGESSPDLMRSLIVDHLELWLLNERTVEIFENTGDTTALFQNKRIVIERGCASTHCVAKLDNSVFWVGDDGSVYRANGYTPQRISTAAIEYALSLCDLSKCFAMTWEDRGHKVYYLTCPDGNTWGYDCATGKWHRRQSYGMNRWRLSTLVQWNGAWYGGEYNGSRLFRLDWDYALEAGQPLVSERTFGVMHDEQNRVNVHAIELVFDTGQPPSVEEAAVPLEVEGALECRVLAEVVNYSYSVLGGVSPVVLTIHSGTLPTGLSMSTGGVVTGTTSAAGLFSWTVRATDALGDTFDLADSAGVLSITGTLPVSFEGTAYDESLTIAGGTTPYVTATVTAGALPTGGTVTIDGTSLVFEWPDTAVAGSYEFTVTVTDSEGCTVTTTQEVLISEFTEDWWLFSTSTATLDGSNVGTRLWRASTPLGFANPSIARSPTASSLPLLAADFLGGHVVAFGGSSEAEDYSSLAPADPQTNALITLASPTGYVQTVVNRMGETAWSRGWVTYDGGATFSTITGPNTGNAVGTPFGMVIRPDGRFICSMAVDIGGDYQLWYSDEAAPGAGDWTNIGAVGSPTVAVLFFLTDGDYIVGFGNSGEGMVRSAAATAGATWTTESYPAGFTDTPRCGDCRNGTFVVGNDDGTSTAIMRSENGGNTWTVVETGTATGGLCSEGVANIHYGGGYWIASLLDGRVLYSTDDGVTWAVLTMPYPGLTLPWLLVYAGDN